MVFGLGGRGEGGGEGGREGKKGGMKEGETVIVFLGVHLQSDEWRDRLVVERLSQHIAYCPRVECGDQICRYFNWFHRHYNQCGKPGMYMYLLC